MNSNDQNHEDKINTENQQTDYSKEIETAKGKIAAEYDRKLKSVKRKLEKQIEKNTETFVELLSESGITHVNSLDGKIHVNPLVGEYYVVVDMSNIKDINKFLEDNM